MNAPLSAEQLEAGLRKVGEERYHDKHPFHQLMNAGKLSKGQLQAWALNRFYYQAMIPIKDAAILSRMEHAELRRAWRQRIIDHDGDNADQGGIRRWIALTDGLGLERAYVESLQGVLPATRFAVEAYVHFVRERSLLEAIASSLTEMFSQSTIRERVSSMLARYDFLNVDVLAYFDRRLTQAPRDADFALNYVKREARTVQDQKAAIAALEFKCAVLWSQLDALYYAYVTPAFRPPGAFNPESVA
ncbi:MAG TPA: pyrroloquinoline-quinone synthase PqqC [Aestuariivirgaceae bacterium]|nr:pyrroloquinoline-quinone synthase PqqC [Aestuariivirgaceae bacterium]